MIDDRITEACQALWWAEVVRSGLRLVMLAMAAVLIWVVVDHWIYSPGMWARAAVFVALVAVGLWYLWRRLLPLLGHSIRPEYAARSLERDLPDLRHSLTSYVTLRGEQISGLRSRMVRSMGAATAGRLRGYDELPAEATGTLRWWIATACLLALLAAYAVVSPKNPFQSALRLAAPLASIDAPKRVSIRDVQPGDVEAIAGRTLEVSAVIDGLRDDEPALCRWDLPSGRNEVTLAADQGGDRFRGELWLPHSVGGEVPYVIAAGDAVAGPFRLRVEDVPVVALQSVTHYPPEYTGTQPHTSSSGAITAIDGTRVKILATTNRAVARAKIEFNPRKLGDAVRATAGATEIEIDATGKSLSVAFPLRSARGRSAAVELESYRIKVWDAAGQSNPEPIIYPIRVIADLPPEVSITLPMQSPKQVPINAQQIVEVHASDPDFGLQYLGLEIRSGIDLIAEPILWSDRRGVVGNRVVEFRFRPEEHRLHIGDTVQIVAVAKDNREVEDDPSVEPNVSRTDPVELKITASESLPDEADPNAGGLSAPDDRPASDHEEQESSSDDASGQDGQQQSGGGGGEGGQSGQSQSGRGDEGQTGEGQTGEGQTGEGETGEGETGEGQTGEGETGEGETGEGETGEGETGEGQTGEGQTGEGQTGEGETGDPQTGEGQTGDRQTADGQAGEDRARDGQAGQSQAGGRGAPDEQSGQRPSRGEDAAGREPTSNQGPNGDDQSGQGQSGQATPDQRQPGDGQGQGGQEESGPMADGGDRPGDASGRDQPPGGQPSDGSSPPQHDGETFERIRDYLEEKQKQRQRGGGEGSEQRRGDPSQQSGDSRASDSRQPSGESAGTDSARSESGERAPDGQQAPSGQDADGDGQAGDASKDDPSRTEEPSPGKQAGQQGTEGAPADGQTPADQQETTGDRGADPSGAMSDQQGSDRSPSPADDTDETSDRQPAQRGDPQGDRAGEASKQPGESQPGGTQPSESDSVATSGAGSDGAGQAGDAPTPPDPVNLEYAKKATDMVLDYLEETRDAPDQELLDQLNWTEEDLKQFAERWQKIRDLDGPAQPQAVQNRELAEALESLGLRSPSEPGPQTRESGDSFRAIRDAGNRKPPPAAFRDAFDAFRRAVGRQQQSPPR